MDYTICTDTINFKYLQNGKILEKEIEIILPDRPEFCNEQGLMLVFELNKLSEKKKKAENKKILDIGKAYSSKQELIQPFLNKLNNQAKIEEEAKKNGQNADLLWADFYLNLSIEEKEFLNIRESFSSDYPNSDYFLDIWKLLINKIYKPTYEPDFNWFNPSIKFEEIVKVYLKSFEKYNSVFLVTGQK